MFEQAIREALDNASKAITADPDKARVKKACTMPSTNSGTRRSLMLRSARRNSRTWLPISTVHGRKA